MLTLETEGDLDWKLHKNRRLQNNLDLKHFFDFALTFWKHGYKSIYIYEFFSVSDEEVPEDSSFVEVTKTYHVLHTVDGGGVHWLDVGGILRRDPVLLQRDKTCPLNSHHNYSTLFGFSSSLNVNFVCVWSFKFTVKHVFTMSN